MNKLGQRNDVALEVLLLENGLHDPASRDVLRELVDRASHRGLDIEVKTLEQQEAEPSPFSSLLTPFNVCPSNP